MRSVKRGLTTRHVIAEPSHMRVVKPGSSGHRPSASCPLKSPPECSSRRTAPASPESDARWTSCSAKPSGRLSSHTPSSLVCRSRPGGKPSTRCHRSGVIRAVHGKRGIAKLRRGAGSAGSKGVPQWRVDFPPGRQRSRCTAPGPGPDPPIDEHRGHLDLEGRAPGGRRPVVPQPIPHTCGVDLTFVSQLPWRRCRMEDILRFDRR